MKYNRVNILLILLLAVVIPATVWAISGTQFVLKDAGTGGVNVTATNAAGAVTVAAMTTLNLGGANLTTTGTITSAAGTPTWSLATGQTLDDGVTDSPAWGAMDATDNYGSIYKINGGNLAIYNDSAAQGISMLAGGDESDYLAFTTTTNVPSITSVGTCNFGLVSSAALEITTTGAIDFYTSGDSGQYLAWTTAANVPTTTITGTTDWSIQADNAAGELLLQLGADTTNYIKFGTASSVPYLAVIGSGNFSIYTDNAAGEIDIMGGGDTSDYFEFDCASNVPILRTVGTCAMQLEASDDTDDYLVYTVASNVPTITATGDCDFELATAAANYVDISTGGLRLADNEYVTNASDVINLYFDDAAANLKIIGFENLASNITLTADQADDAVDQWLITANDSATGTLTIGCDSAVSGTFITYFTIANLGDVTMAGTTPTLTIGDNGSEDSGIVFNNDTDYYFAFDTTGGIAENLLTIGLGSTVGTTPSLGFDASNHTYVINDDSTANAIEDVLTIYKVVNGATYGSNGLGAGIVFIMEDADSTEEQGRINLVFTDVTGDSEDTDWSFSQQIAGSIEERVLFDSNGPTISAIGTLPRISIGDGGNEDNILNFNGQTTHDFYAATDNADDSLIIGYGSTVGTDSRITVQDDADNTLIELGDGAAFDQMVVFDGNATDFYAGVDQTDGDFHIGAGATMATTKAISIADTTQIVTFAQTVVLNGGQTRHQIVDIEDVELDGTVPPAVSQHGTSTQQFYPTLEFDADGGATGDDHVFIHWIVPVGYVTDSLRLNIYWTFDSAETNDDDVVFDMAVNSVAAGETLDAAGTAFTEGDTNIATGVSQDKLFITQLNPEVEEIVVADYVTIDFWVDENVSDLDASAVCDVIMFDLQWESTE